MEMSQREGVVNCRIATCATHEVSTLAVGFSTNDDMIR
jgi:hypothetical protein